MSLPFNTQAELRFTEVRPAGGDVDYFEVRNLRAGKTLIVDLLSGQFDSVLGIFDASGNLLAVDDDGGLGLLSRIELRSRPTARISSPSAPGTTSISRATAILTRYSVSDAT